MSAMLKMREHVAYTVMYSSVANSIQSNYILNVACVFHSCSRLQHFYNVQKFTLKTWSVKPEVDIMMPSLVLKGHVYQ